MTSNTEGFEKSDFENDRLANIVVQSCDPSTLDVEERGSGVQVKSGQGCIRPSLKQMLMKTVELVVINLSLTLCETALSSLCSYSNFLNSLQKLVLLLGD